MAFDYFEDGIDGVDYLRKRQRTRLWFRAMPATDDIPESLRSAIEHAQLTVIAPDLVDAVRVHPVDYAPTGTDVLVSQWLSENPTNFGATVALDQDILIATTEERQLRMLRRLGTQHDISPTVPVATAAPHVGEALTDWRTVPVNAPTLLLAANELLDGRSGGVILGPGVRYRILTAGNGVVGLEVMDENGIPATGFCNAVDLTCIEPMVVGLAGGSWKGTTKQRLQRLSQSISNVTGSLIGTSS